MSTTIFPQETLEPVLNATLPVGKHFLKLVVIDDVGGESEPATVEITVEQVGKPVIDHIDPAVGERGRMIDAVMIGTNLREVKSIRVFQDTQEDQRVIVTPRAGGTAEILPVTIRIFEHAVLGPRTIEVTTKYGVGAVPFTVVAPAPPHIVSITPARASLGHRRPLAARIDGEHLENASSATFLLHGQPDTAVQASIRQATSKALDIGVGVRGEATFGSRAFSVTTPNGTAVSPPNIVFQVLPGIVQVGIMALTIMAALIHLSLLFPDPLFILSGLGYLGLLAALYLPLRWLNRWRTPIRWVLIAYTVATIIAWAMTGDKQAPIAYFTLVLELALVGLLFVEIYQAGAKR